MSILALLSDHRGATQVTPFVRSPAPAEAASAHSTQRYTVSSGERLLSLGRFSTPLAFRVSRYDRDRPPVQTVLVLGPCVSSARRTDSARTRNLLSRFPLRLATVDRNNRRERSTYDTRVYNNIYIYIYIRGGRKRERVFFFFSATVSVACRCRANVSDSPRVPRVSTRVRNIYEIHTVVRCALAYLTARVKKSGHLSVFETERSE